ncbi:PREDICTED: tumor protein p63-regulated gene 1-like protein isoform X2 [Atta colombica]|uniref:tumor protein p63-regulated gene 1-like protein isoform X2 n=1 Tax=Atta colombica TaxID=520822 RepID=UPI00084BD5D2|nr:PREDICTED: tumor protein p63-regulated gene 1-like protein isoform X2 [Atta colombica]
MEETCLEEGPAVNFERATLEIANTDPVRSSTENADNISNQNSASRYVCNVPFKHIDVHTFFTDRNEVVERAISDCTEKLIKQNDDELVGSWLLTEISLWDTEKERLVLLSTKALYSIKYDFISLKILDFNRVPILLFDTIVTGDIIYPSSSLAPKRHMSGIRLMWNRGQPLPLIKKWNPFARNIPWLTYASHPLFWYKDGTEIVKTRFDIEVFNTTLKSLLPRESNVVNMPIIIENYCSLGALVHNRNGLGFFKVRGKISF